MKIFVVQLTIFIGCGFLLVLFMPLVVTSLKIETKASIESSGAQIVDILIQFFIFIIPIVATTVVSKTTSDLYDLLLKKTKTKNDY
jgi:hypothetical protein